MAPSPARVVFRVPFALLVSTKGYGQRPGRSGMTSKEAHTTGGRVIESVESYVIRIYRRYDNQLEGLIEQSLTGERRLFHSAEELWTALTEAAHGWAAPGQPVSSAAAAPEQGLLTARQLHVLSHMCRGKGNKEIAADFGVSYKTIKTHVSAILKALGVTNRTQAVLAAQRLGLRAD